MPLAADCTSCRQTFRVVDTLAGRKVRCPGCQTPVRIPELPLGEAAGTDDNIKSLARAKGTDAEELTPELVEMRLSPEDEEPIRGELTRGERLIWTGRPAPDLLLWGKLAQAVGLGVFGLIFVAVGGNMLRKGEWIGLPFLAAGLGVIGYGAYLPVGARIAGRKKRYALTNRRALVLTCNGDDDINADSYYPADLTNFRCREWWFFQDGAGDLIFRSITIVTRTTYRNQNTGRERTETSKSTTHFGFLAVRHARQLERLVRAVLVDPVMDKIYDD